MLLKYPFLIVGGSGMWGLHIGGTQIVGGYIIMGDPDCWGIQIVGGSRLCGHPDCEGIQIVVNGDPYVRLWAIQIVGDPDCG